MDGIRNEKISGTEKVEQFGDKVWEVWWTWCCGEIVNMMGGCWKWSWCKRKGG